MPHALPRRSAWLFMLIAVLLVAANMRTTIMAVGPLLEEIADDRGTTAAALGALASIPLITWGLVSPLAHGLGARFGMSRAVTLSLITLLIGTIWRSLPGFTSNLWLGTVLIGASLAIGNVLLPAIIKREFSARRIPLVMGLYTAILGGIGSLGAGVVVPIARLQVGGAELGWRIALACTGILVPIALIVWIIANRGRDVRRTEPTGPAESAPAASRGGIARSIWKDRLAWWVSAYMGSQSAVSYIFFTWLAPILTSRGTDPAIAGFATMLFQFTGIIGSMVVPLLFSGRLRSIAPALVPSVMVVAAVGVIFIPQGMLLWIVVGGVTAGAALSTSILLMGIRARDAETASALSGMSQSVGYIIAAVGPLAFGWLFGLTGGWTAPFLVLLAALALQFCSGVAVRTERFVLPPETPASGGSAS